MSDSWVYFQGSLIVYRPVVMLWGGSWSFFGWQCQADIRGLVTA